MLATVDSCLLAGMEGRLVEVQADAANGDPHFFLVGLASASVKEARDRVRSAIRNSGMRFPQRRLTVNLAPPEMRKEGSCLDLPIAVAILLAHQGLKPPPRSAFLGELALDGTVRHVDGVLVAARWLRGILPPLELGEALEVAQVRSLLGELPPGRPVDWVRPFRAPHHGISLAGLIGGGSGLANPGEISRSHQGVLFLDELAEFQSTVLQALRQPLEAGRVTITRSGGSVAYPARFTLAAATTPCPSGWAGDARRVCRCTPAAIDTYQRKLSGPLLDRIDLKVNVRRVPPALLASEPMGEASEPVRERVIA